MLHLLLVDAGPNSELPGVCASQEKGTADPKAHEGCAPMRSEFFFLVISFCFSKIITP
jgi:hypothetical protein